MVGSKSVGSGAVGHSAVPPWGRGTLLPRIGNDARIGCGIQRRTGGITGCCGFAPSDASIVVRENAPHERRGVRDHLDSCEGYEVCDAVESIRQGLVGSGRRLWA
jgi:hypothetical protein